MITGIVWPRPRAITPPPTVQDLNTLRIYSGAKGIRIDHPVGATHCALDSVRLAGLMPWPILTHDRYAPAEYADRALWLVSKCPWLEDVELENEPGCAYPERPAYTPAEYGLMARAALRALRGTTWRGRAWLFGEVLDTVKGVAKPYHQIVRQIVPPEWYFGVAGHFYREPRRPSWTAPCFVNRRAEWNEVRSLVGSKPIAVTEFGWQVRYPKYPLIQKRITLETQAKYLREEVATLQALGAYAAFVYAYGGAPGEGYGIFDQVDGKLLPRPSAMGLFEGV